METEERRAIEAVLMVAETPVEPSLLAQLLELSPARVARDLRGAGPVLSR